MNSNVHGDWYFMVIWCDYISFCGARPSFVLSCVNDNHGNSIYLGTLYGDFVYTKNSKEAVVINTFGTLMGVIYLDLTISFNGFRCNHCCNCLIRLISI